MIAFVTLIATIEHLSRPLCPEVVAALSSRIDSAKAIPGQTFGFRTLATVRPIGNLPEIPARTPGYGVVEFADHARGGGVPGKLVLEPRYLRLADGTHVQVMSEPQYTDQFVQGGTGNVGGPLQYVPGVGGIIAGGYNMLHHGKDVAAKRGTQLHLLLSDALASRACRVPAP